MDVIAGAWVFGSNSAILRFFDHSPLKVVHRSNAAAEPLLAMNPAWAASAASERSVLIGDIRLDHPADLAHALGIPHDRMAALGPAGLALAAWDCWGLDAFSRLEGDYALAIWDRTERRLVLVRDSLGQRPLYYRRTADAILFGSVPIPLVAVQGRPQVDYDMMATYLAGYPYLDQRSFIAGVERVMPGHLLILRGSKGSSQQRWWNPDQSLLRMSHAEAAEQVRMELDRAVDALLVTKAPAIAADLSAGLDSSLVVETAARRIGEQTRLLTFTGASEGLVDRPPGRFQDEAQRAQETAAMLGVSHRGISLPSKSPLAALERWLPSAQLPLANGSNLGWIDGCYSAAAEAGATAYLTGGNGNFTVSRAGVGRLRELADSGRFATLAHELRAFRRFRGGSWRGALALGFGHRIPTPIFNRLASNSWSTGNGLRRRNWIDARRQRPGSSSSVALGDDRLYRRSICGRDSACPTILPAERRRKLRGPFRPPAARNRAEGPLLQPPSGRSLPSPPGGAFLSGRAAAPNSPEISCAGKSLTAS